MANMMKLTVKTLDSFNHIFQVETEATVLQLKHQIRESLSLEIDQQRLIFCGRVLQDEQKLNDCGVNDGKCLHLVQRPPPSPPSRRRERDRERQRERERISDRDRENIRRDFAARHPGGALPDHLRQLLAGPPDLVYEQQQSMSMTPTNGRMEFIRRMITEIRESLESIRNHLPVLEGSGDTREPPIEPMDIDSAQNEVPNNAEEDDDDEDNDDPPSAGSNERRSRDARVNRSGHASTPRGLGQLIEELDSLHDEFAPYRAQYVASLRDLSRETFSESERLFRQHTVYLINDVIHSFAHAYHSISDITFHVGHRYPRLSSEQPSASRYPIPMQAHINVVTTTGRRSRSEHGRGRATAPAGPAATSTPISTVTPPTVTTPAPSVTVNTSETLSRAAASVVAGVPTTPTVTQDEASPRCFQVEIEASGHLAFPIDNSLLNGLAAVASNLHQAEQGQDLASETASAPPETTPAPASTRTERVTRSEPITRTERTTPSRSNRNPEPENNTTTAHSEPRASSSDSGEIPPESLPSEAPPASRSDSQPPPRNRPAASQEGTPTTDNRQTEAEPRALTDLENLLRSLSQGGGVEVVTSMADMPGNLFDTDNEHGGVYVTPLEPSQGRINHTAEFLQNIIANVVRQNIGGAMLLQGQSLGLTGLTQARSQNQGQNRQTPNTTQRQTTQGQTTNQRPGQTTNQRPAAAGQERTTAQETPNQGTNQRQNQQNRNTNTGRRQQWQVLGNMTRTQTDRVHSLMMACMVYDRHLPCDSPFARRHLHERREHYAAQVEEQERYRMSRVPAPVLEVLMSRNDRFSPSHMGAMMRLTVGPVCQEGQLNALMITIARHLILDPMNEFPNDPAPMPSEFPFIRMQLREYVQGMLETAIESGGRTNTFEAVTERVIAQNLDFLRHMPREHVPHMVDLAMLHDGFTGDNAFDPIADYYVERHSDFLRNMHLITPIENDIDPIASVRVMTRSRLPAIIACVMSEASSDMFAARFYSVFARFFTDMSTLFFCFCTEGFDGLLLVFNAFIGSITENYESTTRDWLRTISRENLIAIQNNLEPNIETTARQYFRRADGSMPPTPERLNPANRPIVGDVLHIDHVIIDEDHTVSGAFPPFLRAAVMPNVDGESSSTMSPELRSPGELTIPRSESPFREWDNSSPVGPHSVPSGLDSPNLPGGIITIGLGSSSNSSLYDPDENNDDFIDADGPDDYEFTEMQRTLLDRQLHLLEDEEENLEVDVENDDGVPVNLPGRSRRPDPYAALSQAAMRVDATRLRGQALRRGRLDPTAFAMRQLDLRMEQGVVEQSARERAADAQLLVALERLQHIADMQTREAHGHAERMRTPPPAAPAPAPAPEIISDSAPPSERTADSEPAEPDSEYSTPPANTQPPTAEEPEFLEPNEPDRAASPTIHPIYHIDMTEPEFLVPINNLRNRLNSNLPRNEGSANEPDRISPDADRLIINEDVINEDVDFNSDCDIRPNESGENSGYLTPFSRNRADYSTPQSMPRTDSNESMTEAPPVQDDNNDGEPCIMELAMRQITRLRENSSPPPGTSRQEAMSPDLETSSLHSLLGLEGNQDAQTNPPTEPQIETENENVECSNEDAAMASAQAPMESVFEHFESNWAPVFREDEAAQERPTRPQEPFSDAYLSGMPSRKRRCVRESRPDPSLEGLMTEGVGASGADDVHTEELREFLRESVRSLVRHRSQREPENFSTSQFQNTAAFIDADKPTKEEEEAAAAAAPAPAATPSASETPPPEPAE